jgi:histidine triad (HIT) family protein
MDSQDNSGSGEGCIFCAIAAGEAPSIRVYEDEHTVAFMDINPATRGHVLVIPRLHARDLLDVSGDELLHVMSTVQRVAFAVEEALHPDGINLIQANRRAAFQSVYHFHVHVIPRWWDDGLRPPWSHRAGDPDELRELGQRVKTALDEGLARSQH